MYIFTNRLKLIAISLVFLGALGWGYSYVNSKKSLEEIKVMLAEEDSHHETAAVTTEHMPGEHAAVESHSDDHA